MPTVKLLNYQVLGESGQQIEAWGYNFTIHRNGDALEALLEMPLVDAEREQGAGRVVIVTYDKPEKLVERAFAFAETPEDFFGCKSSAELREQLKAMSKAALIAFAKKYLSMDFPPATGKDALVGQICLKAESLAEKGE